MRPLPGFLALAAAVTAVAFAEREQIVAAIHANRAQPFHAGVALLEREVDPSPPLVAAVFVALVDLGLVGAVGVFFRFDQQIEPPHARAISDVFVAVALANGAEPRVFLRARLETAMYPRDAPDVIEDDVVVAALGHHAAGLEHVAVFGGLNQLAQRALGDEGHDGTGLGHSEKCTRNDWQPKRLTRSVYSIYSVKTEMTETKEKASAGQPALSVQQKFILHWGEMGTRWGVNRTVAQVHALLYISPRPLNADDIVETLEVARSNVSTSLKELQGWGIVKLVHVRGDKRDHFESMKDVWEMFRVVMDERKKREFDPTMRMLHECIAEAAKDKATDEYTEERLRELYKFFETTSALYVQVRRWPTAAMFKFMKTGDKVLKVLGLGA